MLIKVTDLIAGYGSNAPILDKAQLELDKGSNRGHRWPEWCRQIHFVEIDLRPAQYSQRHDNAKRCRNRWHACRPIGAIRLIVCAPGI